MQYKLCSYAGIQIVLAARGNSTAERSADLTPKLGSTKKERVAVTVFLGPPQSLLGQVPPLPSPVTGVCSVLFLLGLKAR
jgi:hypothetical protein